MQSAMVSTRIAVSLSINSMGFAEGRQLAEFALSMAGRFALLRGLQDRGDDRGIGAAAANVAGHPFGDLLSTRGRIGYQQRLGRHDLTRRAKPALGANIAYERFL